MPRITSEDKARNRQSIVEAAGRMLRSQGVDAQGVAEPTKEAGLTHGGFYNYFASKGDLAAEACGASFGASPGVLDQALEEGADEGSRLGPDTGKARLWEPHRLRLRVFTTAGQLVTTGRRQILRLARHRPWTSEIAGAFERLAQLPNPG